MINRYLETLSNCQLETIADARNWGFGTFASPGGNKCLVGQLGIDRPESTRRGEEAKLVWRAIWRFDQLALRALSPRPELSARNGSDYGPIMNYRRLVWGSSGPLPESVRVMVQNRARRILACRRISGMSNPRELNAIGKLLFEQEVANVG